MTLIWIGLLASVLFGLVNATHFSQPSSGLSSPIKAEKVFHFKKRSTISIEGDITGGDSNFNVPTKLTRFSSRLQNGFIPYQRNVSSVKERRSLPNSRNVLLTQHFNEKLVSPGDDVSLQCSATSSRPPKFIWERDAVAISSNIEPRYNLAHIVLSTGVVVSSFNISRARVEDGGLYTCTAVDGDIKASHSARVDVYGPPYIRNLPPIKIQSGNEMKLRCPFYGYPVNKIEWEHKGKKILSASLAQPSRYKRNPAKVKASRLFKKTRRKRRQLYDVLDSGLLVVPRVSKEDHGATYTCVVYSPSGEMARRSFEIQVVEAPELDELRVGSGLKEGQIVQITCNIIGGDPPIYFSWLKDGVKIPSNLKVSEKSLELFSVLVIKKVSLEHVGKYSCIATNHVGKTNQTAELYINVAPKWIEEPTNVSLLLGQRGAVHCNANGYPAPQTHWMKRDAGLGIWRPVLDLAGGGVMSLTNGTLVIEVVSITDEGTYACHVENGIGEPLNKNIWISVNKPVHFESLSTNLTTKIGLPVDLTCHALGDNPIWIKWLHDGVPIDYTTSRVSFKDMPSENGIRSTIKIHYADGTDRGRYECHARNKYGQAEYTLYLIVLEPPTPPLDVQIDSISSRSAKLSWRDTIRTHVQYYSVQYTIGDFLSWDGAKTFNVTRIGSIQRQSTELVDLKPAQDYRVRVASGNQVDISQYTQPAHFTTQQEAPSSAPIGVQVQSTENPGELATSWLPPGRETTNGVIQGYHVRAEPKLTSDNAESQTKVIKVMPRNGKHETTISGLLKNTRYAVSVSAFNAAGNGPFSVPVIKITREGAPEAAPSSVECRGVSSSSLRVAWQPIIAHGSSILGYYVYYSNEDGLWQNISSSHTETYLQGLMKYTNYTVKIAGYNNYGIGPTSHPILCASLQDVPGPPSSIKVVVASTSSLLVSWFRPRDPNGEITHYTVYIKASSSSLSSQSFRVEATAESELPTRYMTFELKNLSEGKQYEVSVTGSTIAGEGFPISSQNIEISARVVAGVVSLGGTVSVGVGSSLLLVCQCVGVPQPRTVWYHKQNIITHHPRFTRNHDDSLLINNIDVSLGGNYTCLARNLYGSDSVSYLVYVLPAPEPPKIKAEAGSHELRLIWDQPRGGTKIAYDLSWKEAIASWQDSWSSKSTQILGRQDYVVDSLKCGTKYSIRMTSSNSVGTSSPAYLDITTLGGVPIAPSNTEWFWSNSSHIFIQLTGWEDNGCEIMRWTVEYRPYGSKEWLIADNNLMLSEPQWKKYISPNKQLSTIVIPDLKTAHWYQIKVTAENAAGITISVFNYATTTILGETIGPPTELLDLNMLVIIFSSILLTVCLLLCIYIIMKRNSQRRFSEYRNSLTVESKSERSNITINTPQSVTEANRIYSTPIHVPTNNKQELYEISPYAQFAIGFRTFGHVENQEAPRMLHGSSKSRYDSETSFQVRSESEESDCMSRTNTLKSVPRKSCRVQHHR